MSYEMSYVSFILLNKRKYRSIGFTINIFIFSLLVQAHSKTLINKVN